MWVVLAIVSALCLGFYDVSKKKALQQGDVVTVLAGSVGLSACILLVPMVLSAWMPEKMSETMWYVPQLDSVGHGYVWIKSCIVLSSWAFAYISVKYLPLSVVSPMQATRPMWTLMGAMVLFGERLNMWQWIGVVCALGSIFIFSLVEKKAQKNDFSLTKQEKRKYYFCLVMAILIGAASGLYDKYMMRRYDHNAVQVYYTVYQAIMMGVIWAATWYKKQGLRGVGRALSGAAGKSGVSVGSAAGEGGVNANGAVECGAVMSEGGGVFVDNRLRDCIGCTAVVEEEKKDWRKIIWPIVGISVFLVISDYVYMVALSDKDSMIAVVSTIRRGGTIIPFLYGILILKEKNAAKKIACLCGVAAGLLCLALGTM